MTKEKDAVVMKQLFLLFSLLAIYQTSSAVNPIPAVNGAPQSGNYYVNGVYGSTMTVNGGTTYFSVL